MNRLYLQDFVQGNYGRKIAYTDVEEITEENIIKVVGSCIGTFNWNKPIFKYLWNYYKGDQPIRYRQKVVRDDVNNPIVENHAWEIVRFKNGQTNGEPIQCVSTKKEERINKDVDRFNDYCRAAGNPGETGEKGDTGATGAKGADDASVTTIVLNTDAGGAITGGTATLSDGTSVEITVTTESV